MRRAASLLIVLLLVHGTAWAAGNLDVFGKFFAGGTEFDLALYTESGEKVALIGIGTDGKKTSVAFEPAEWQAFAKLWQEARKVDSSTWQPVGSFKETGTTELALLTVAAGPGIQFNITGNKGPFVFTLPASDFSSFDTKVAEMAEKLR